MTSRRHILNTLNHGFDVIEDEREAMETAVDIVALILGGVPSGARAQVGAILVASAANKLARREHGR